MSRFDPAERAAALWASEAPGALGASPYEGDTPLAVYRRKIGEIEAPDLDNLEHIQLGHEFQPAIGALFAKRTGLTVRDAGDAIGTCPTEPRLRAHTDFFTDDGALLEVKFYGPHKAREFGESGTDDVPLYLAIQCMHEACAFGVSRVYAGCQFGNQAFRWFQLDFAEADQARYIDRVRAFWARVELREPPDPLHPADVLSLHPRDNGMMAVATAEDARTVATLAAIKRQLSELDARKVELEAALKMRIGSASALVGPGGQPLATWKASKDTTRLDTKALAAAHPDIAARYTQAVPGSRRLIIKGE